MLKSLEFAPPTTPTASLIWLHGLGADSSDFAFLKDFLAMPSALGLRYVLPDAPERPVTLNGGLVMRAWYDIAVSDLGRSPDLAGIDDTLTQIEALLDAEIQRGIDPGRIVLGGFSQGAVLAMEAASRLGKKLGGAIALSGYLAKPSDDIPAADSCACPILMAHGTEDTVVPYSLGFAAFETLKEKGYPIDWNAWPIGHSVCPEELGVMRNWILQRLEENSGVCADDL